jgi:hypothetical protein
VPPARAPHITRGRVRADQVTRRLPRLAPLYRADFPELAERAIGDPVDVAGDERYGTAFNVLRGTQMRFKCHPVFS